MGVISVVLLVLFVIASMLLVLVVLVQDDQGEGFGGLFGGSAASFGARTGNILTKFPTVLAVAFLVGAFALAWLNRTPELGDVVNRARLESLRSGEEDENWWVEAGEITGDEETIGETAESTTEAGASGDGAGEASAASESSGTEGTASEGGGSEGGESD
ncbi:MAG: preprotein translocase subunit SecG [Candidatus Eisenbacteria bacterium]|nr:preprotein translocase subunit SecG [Candidatus Eisenbacteria bacterium]